MIEITDYQWEQVAAFLGDFGFVLIMLGFCANFIYQGLRKNPR